MLPPQVPVAAHGGPQAAGDKALDFSVNTNPLGPNPALIELWRAANLADYPDPHYQQAREALADFHGYPPEGVVLGVGASELLHRIARAFVQPGDQVLSLGAPFGEFQRAVALQGGQLDVAERTGRVDASQARLVYLSNPHNPTGHYLPPNELPDAPLLVVDEAYRPFLAEAQELEPLPNLIRVQSPGKAHGLLGMRLAYALASPKVAARLDNLQPSWALPAPVADVLAALPQQSGFLQQTLPTVRSWASELALAIGARPSGLHFFTVRVADAQSTAAELLARGLHVRDCTSFGHPDLIRVTTRTPKDNRRLVSEWRALAN
jgi:histidinol-phosphate aminotransferase